MLAPYDLHIHSCLSPCGEEEMTPNNIVGMAQILELSVFAVADHNTARNLPAVRKLAEEAGLLLIPAMEITTAEEVHVLSLFPSVEAALEMGEEVYAALPPVRNKPDIFGYQRILDENDEPVGELEKLLINAAMLPIDAVFEKVRGYGGVPIPAHIDKSANSVLANLGVIPPELEAKTVEISPRGIDRGFAPPDGEEYFVITDSDAHDLETMSGHEARALELEIGMTRLFFVRHAQPQHSWKDDRTRPLTEEGMQDTARVLEFFRNVPPDAVYSSPYRRSVDTIKSAAEYWQKEIHTDERLRERESGTVGSSGREMIQKRWADFDYHEPGGESIGMAQER